MVFKIGVVLGALAGYLVGSGKVNELVAQLRGASGRSAAGTPGPDAVHPSGATTVVSGPGVSTTLLIPNAAP